MKVLLLSGLVCLLGVTSGLAVKYNEAPMLKTKVAVGEIPPVEERLPENPLVVPVVERIGKYGGTLKSAYIPGDPSIANMFCCFEYLLHMDSDGDQGPNIAEKVEFSPDAKVVTVHLRKGIRWSDGEPFTADDVMFWYEDVALNKEITPVPPSWIAIEGGRIEKIDDYTVRFIFPIPNHLRGMGILRANYIYMPKHYLKQFHPKYASKEKLEKMVKEKGFESWWQLFGERSNIWFGPVGLPVLGPWFVKSITPVMRVYERNPYFWKVDPAGNQLPYIDRVVFFSITEKEMYVLKAIQGEIDLSSGWILTFGDYPLLEDSAEKENYRVLQWDETDVGQGAFIFRQEHPDLVLRKLFRDKRFRIAMSLALNREEISECYALGKARVTQATAMPGSPLYREEFAKAYVEYDPDKANQLLDEIELTKREKGYRLRPDGKPLIITIWGTSDCPDRITIGELVAEYWKAVGINTLFKVVDRSLYNVKSSVAGEMEVDYWGFGGCLCPLRGLFEGMFGYFIPNGYGNHTGPDFVKWYRTEGKEGVEPPAYLIESQNLFEKIKRTSATEEGEKERIRLGIELCRLEAENLTIISTVSAPPRPIVVKNYVHNVPEKGIWAWEIRCHKRYFNEQIFIEK